jgi:type II secretory pathway pseudopilin PulG
MSLASVAIIAFVGYFFWGQYQDGQDRQRLEAFSVERNACLTSLDMFVRGNQDAKPDVDRCVNGLFIRSADVEAAAKKHGR